MSQTAPQDQQQLNTPEPPLTIQRQSFVPLKERLAQANTTNPDFEEQYTHLQAVLLIALERLGSAFPSEIEQVRLKNQKWLDGIDLRDLPYGDVVLEIVLNSSAQRSYELYKQISRAAFAKLDRKMFLPQFVLINQSEWRHAEMFVEANGRPELLGLLLLGRV